MNPRLDNGEAEMQTDVIIKLIGHRPVYRVDFRAAALALETDGPESAGHGAPVIEQEARNRFISGMEEREPYERWF